MIHITVNGKPQEVEEGTSVYDLAKKVRGRLAVWHNKTRLRQSQQRNVIVQENDEVKIQKIASGG